MERKVLQIDALSDTHNQHAKFTCAGGDILLHTGDCTSSGRLSEALAFLDWFGSQKYTHKIMIPGNHDWIFEENPTLMKEEAEKRGIHLLNDSGVTVEGISVWGSPVQPWFHSWAFNRHINEDDATVTHPWIKPHWDMIPEGIEILLTHGPAHMILDKVVRGDFNVGCPHLAKRIEDLGVSLHVCGHIHESRGFEYGRHTTYVNASSLNHMYYPAAAKPMRITREICQDGSIAYIL